MTKVRLCNKQNAISLTKAWMKQLEAVAREAVRMEALPYEVELDITLVDNDAIRTLNREHRGKDAATDVLSFPNLDYVKGKAILLPGDRDPDTGRVALGDIMVSLERMREQALEYGHSEAREGCFLVAHGVLHLLGYDHEETEDEVRMFARQEEILQQMGILRTGEGSV